MPHSLRRPTLDDAAGVHALMCACDIANLGHPDCTLDDVLEELKDPDISLDDDAWLAVDESGDIVACGFVFPHGDSDIVEMDVYVHPDAAPALYTELWDVVEQRASEFGRFAGHPEVRLDTGVHRIDERTRAELERRGFGPATVWYRMRTDHEGGVLARPELPPGVAIEVAGDDERLRRDAVDIDNEAFSEHYGFVERDYAYRLAKFAASTTTGWDQTRVISVDGVSAGLLVASTQYVEDENCGYIPTLGVGKQFRGRGLARLLLLDAFARDTEDGRAGTILHVDANNVTPALGLYESVGMRVVLAIDGFRKKVAL